MVTSKSKQLIATADGPNDEQALQEARQILSKVGPIGRQFLDDLRDGWGEYERTTEKPLLNDDDMLFTLKDEDGNPIRDDDGNLITATEQVTEWVSSPIKKRHQGVAPAEFYRYALTVKSEEQRERLTGLIRTQRFELDKALAVAELVPVIIGDRSIKPTTWSECEALNAPSLATMRKYRGGDLTSKAIYTMLIQFAKRFGRRNDLSEDDCSDLADDILNEFYLYTIAEIKMVLTLAMKRNQKENKIYTLDYSTAYRLFAEMYEARGERLARIAEREHRFLTTDRHERTSQQRGIERLREFLSTPDRSGAEYEIVKKAQAKVDSKK